MPKTFRRQPVNPYQMPLETHAAATGKSENSLAYSRQRRADILRLFGGTMPTSIMKAQKEQRASDLASGSYDETGYKNPDNEWATGAFNVSGRGAQGGGLSMFPQNIGRIMIRLYTEPGKVCFDPFAGHNSRMELCVSEGLDYIGCDLSKRFMAWNEARAVELRKEFPDRRIELHLGDSRAITLADASADFTITSPPYYRIEKYGDEPEQLGWLGTYADFMAGLREVVRHNFRILRPGAFACWFINDFRWDGKFYSYHRDLSVMMEQEGFVPQDIVVVDLGYPMRAAFAQELIRTKIIPKQHEYGLVMCKP